MLCENLFMKGENKMVRKIRDWTDLLALGEWNIIELDGREFMVDIMHLGVCLTTTDSRVKEYGRLEMEHMDFDAAGNMRINDYDNLPEYSKFIFHVRNSKPPNYGVWDNCISLAQAYKNGTYYIG